LHELGGLARLRCGRPRQQRDGREEQGVAPVHRRKLYGNNDAA